MTTDWAVVCETLRNFGGAPVTLHVSKTGLPFFDALRLYGAIDLYIGLREETSIRDEGARWVIEGRRRIHRIEGRALRAIKQVWTKRRPSADDVARLLEASLADGGVITAGKNPVVPAVRALTGVDAALQAGVRDTSAGSYETLESGQTSEGTCCVARIPLSEAVLAFAGRVRTETVGDVVFLPIFEGRVDFGKVVSPLRSWLSRPNVLFAQALVLLSLKASLFAEGYQDRLTAVAFTTSLDSRRHANYSGLIAIASTAVGRIRSSGLAWHLAVTYRDLVRAAWDRGQATRFMGDALATTYWLMHPTSRKNLSGMLTSQEHLRSESRRYVFFEGRWAREVFEMTYGDWQGDHRAVRAFAKAMASAIFFARMRESWEKKDFEGARKAWYDEVVMLRSSPSAKAFMARSLILLEQGHREHSGVGTCHRQEDFDPEQLLRSIQEERSGFETFRDLFRMYLLQESTGRLRPGEAGQADDRPPESVSGENERGSTDEEDKE